ncbi:MAG: D-glycerate dehydrogenase [Aggregatilineales bacterium]
MTKPHIYITRNMPQAGIKLLEPTCTLTIGADLPPDRATLLKNIAEADAVLSLLTETIDAEVMDVAPNLKVISNMAVGYDNIRINDATSRGIPVGNTPGVLTETTADIAFALMLSAARRLPEAERYVKDGHWKTWMPSLLLGQDLHGATLGILGLGRIGQAVARRAKGFNMRIIYHGGSDETAARELGAEACTMETLLEQSDFISIHTPLMPETHHMIDAEAFARMKSTAVLVNTARGGIVDPKALYDALKSRQIAAAGLDVTEPEPISPDDPLLTLDNCLIIPHLGSSSVATRDKMATLAAENVLAGLRGDRLPHCVNPEVYDRR